MLGYGMGYVGQGGTYNFMTSYFVVFLTSSVGLNSAMAGSIMSIALLVEVIAGMVVGNMSDKCKSNMGKRRPFILGAALTMPIIMILVMRTIGGSESVKFTYYLIMSILFRMSFSCFEIPNNAFGAEIASGYDERTRLRTISRAFSILGNTVGYVLPLWILELFPDDEAAGWQAIGITIAVVSFVSWLTAFKMTAQKAREAMERSRLNPPSAETDAAKGNGKPKNIVKDILVNYLELAKLRTMRLLIVYKAAFACAFSLFNVATIYYLRYSLGLGNRYSSYMYVLTIIVFVITTPIANKMAVRFGKSAQQMIVMGLGAAISLAVFLLAPSSMAGAVCYVIIFSVVQSSFWQLSSSIFYDVVEVDEFVNFKRREGDIMSLVSVLGTLTTAVIVQIFGILLDSAGFQPGAAVQSAGVVHFLNGAYILAPGICLAIAFAALKIFPINKTTFGSLISALACRREGKDYSAYLADVEKLL